MKIIAVILAIWLLNVVFVAVHEAGHAAIATAFGARVASVYVSPMGIDGSIAHTVLPEKYQACLVLAGGVLFSTLATLAAYVLRSDIAVYVLGLRSVESLINFTQGSDMSGLLTGFGSGAAIVSIALSITIILLVASTFHRRYTASKPVEVSDRPAHVVPTSTT